MVQSSNSIFIHPWKGIRLIFGIARRGQPACPNCRAINEWGIPSTWCSAGSTPNALPASSVESELDMQYGICSCRWIHSEAQSCGGASSLVRPDPVAFWPSTVPWPGGGACAGFQLTGTSTSFGIAASCWTGCELQFKRPPPPPPPAPWGSNSDHSLQHPNPAGLP